MNDLCSNKKKALDKIAFYLARRDHSEKELAEKLKKKFENETIQEAIAEAQLQGWLKPPLELAKQIYRVLNDRRKGAHYIQNYLKRLGLPIVVIDEELEHEKASSLLKSKFDDWETYNFEQKQKPVRFLQSRGFSLDVIKKLLFYR